MRGDWGHLYWPEYCSVCGQNPFECGCLNVSFDSRREKRWREERERERGTGKMIGTDQAILEGDAEEMAELSLRVQKWKELRRGKAVVAVVGLAEMNGFGAMEHGGSGQNRG